MWVAASSHQRATSRLKVATWVMHVLCALRTSVEIKVATLGSVHQSEDCNLPSHGMPGFDVLSFSGNPVGIQIVYQVEMSASGRIRNKS